MPGARSEHWPIGKLNLWDRNPRSIKGDRFNELKERLKRQGQIKPLLVTEDGTVIGGNMRLRAMKDLGWTDVWVSVTEAKTDKEIFDLALTDNEEFGYYEKEQVAELALELGLSALELKSYALQLGEATTLDLILDELGPEITEEDDEAPEVDEGEPESKLGEVYQLGRHRLMCGSATELADVQKLMDGAKADMVFTDPPYGMNAVSGSGVLKDKYGTDILGDDDNTVAINSFVLVKALGIEKQIWWGANYYSSALPDSECWLVWDKNNGGSDQTDAELAWTNLRSVVRMFQKASEKINRVHPTQKPIELIVWAFSHFGSEGDNVIDLFGGSGSTLIAADKTNRTCYMMELDPKYCDVIRKRYWKHVNGDEEGWQDGTRPAKEKARAA